MKILLYNMGYATGINGKPWQYFLKAWRYLWCSRQTLTEIGKVLRQERADLVCLLETDTGSIRNWFESQVGALARVVGLPFFKSLPKYGPRSWWQKLPMLRKNADGVLSNQKGILIPHYLHNGMKRLVQEYRMNDISVFIVHLSRLRGKTRQKQLKELSVLLNECTRPYVLCGDFNIYKGKKEIADFADQNSLTLIETNPTFPSARPRKQLDLFMASAGVQIEQSGVVQTQLSDHLPVWVKI